MALKMAGIFRLLNVLPKVLNELTGALVVQFVRQISRSFLYFFRLIMKNNVVNMILNGLFRLILKNHKYCDFSKTTEFFSKTTGENFHNLPEWNNYFCNTSNRMLRSKTYIEITSFIVFNDHT